MRSRVAIIVALVAVLAAACSQSDPQASSPAPSSRPSPSSTKPCARPETGTTAHRDVRYASSPGIAPGLQSLDLYLPPATADCRPVPMVVYVHGGAFRVGDKTNRIAGKSVLFTGAGWGFASVNYRLVGAPGAGATNGRYPAAEQDVAAAVGYLADHASEYGLDPHRIMLIGHSAGAFLVSIVSTDGSFLDHAGVQLADVVCTVPLDTTYDVPTQVGTGGVNAAMYRNVFGDDPAVWAKGSPRRNVEAGKDIPAFHVVTRGNPRRVAEAQAFGTVLRDAGVRVDVQVATGLTHEAVNSAVGAAGDTVITPPLMTFFQGCAA